MTKRAYISATRQHSLLLVNHGNETITVSSEVYKMRKVVAPTVVALRRQLHTDDSGVVNVATSGN